MTLYALTIRQPWANCIVHGDKRIENRTWPPPNPVVGEPLAIHAGMVLDDDPATTHFVYDVMQMPFWDESELVRGAIIGVARLVEVLQASDDRWFSGPYGWVLEDVLPIEPVVCRGRPGVWTVPTAVLATVREHYHTAVQIRAAEADDYTQHKRFDLP
jgi:hypothetical protein